MSYEESKLLSLLKKQDIDSLFLEATNYLCQTKSLFEEKKQLQQENEQLKERIEYLERSNNRREDTILEQRQEISNLEDTYCDRTDCSSRIKDSKKHDSLKQKYDKQVDNWNKLKADLELVVGYSFGDEASRWDKTYGEHAKATLNYMRELEQRSDSNE